MPLAVVLTNQMTTRFNAADVGFQTPALGDSFSHASNHRVLLTFDPARKDIRHAHLLKSPRGFHEGGNHARYCITTAGIRDVPADITYKNDISSN